MQGRMQAPGFKLWRHHGLQTQGLLINYLFECGVHLDHQRVVALPLFDINYEDSTSRAADKSESLNVLKKKIQMTNFVHCLG